MMLNDNPTYKEFDFYPHKKEIISSIINVLEHAYNSSDHVEILKVKHELAIRIAELRAS